MLPKYNYVELDTISKMITNDYDWTIAYTYSRNIENEKKGLIFDLQKVPSIKLLLEIRPDFYLGFHSH